LPQGWCRSPSGGRRLMDTSWCSAACMQKEFEGSACSSACAHVPIK
jgi:hypothetical protein